MGSIVDGTTSTSTSTATSTSTSAITTTDDKQKISSTSKNDHHVETKAQFHVHPAPSFVPKKMIDMTQPEESKRQESATTRSSTDISTVPMTTGTENKEDYISVTLSSRNICVNHDHTFHVPKEYTPINFAGNGAWAIVGRFRHIPSQTLVAIKKITDPFHTSVISDEQFWKNEVKNEFDQQTQSLRNKLIVQSSQCSRLQSITVTVPRVIKTIIPSKELKRTVRQIKAFLHFRHPNIVKLLDIIPSPKLSKTAFDPLYLVLENMEVNLHRLIRVEKDSTLATRQFTIAHVQSWIYQLLRGVRYMHSCGVMHRDLKPSNILINSDTSLKISDFDMIGSISHSNDQKENLDQSAYIVTRWYRAPEIILSTSGAHAKYNDRIDVWSIGCILGELMALRPLFRGDNPSEQMRVIFKTLGLPSKSVLQKMSSPSALAHWTEPERVARYPSLSRLSKSLFQSYLFDNDALDLLTKMLTIDPSQRITIEDAIRHPFLKNNLEYYPLSDDVDKSKTILDFSYEQQMKWDQFSVQIFLWAETLKFRPSAYFFKQEWLVQRERIRRRAFIELHPATSGPIDFYGVSTTPHPTTTSNISAPMQISSPVVPHKVLVDSSLSPLRRSTMTMYSQSRTPFSSSSSAFSAPTFSNSCSLSSTSLSAPLSNVMSNTQTSMLTSVEVSTASLQSSMMPMVLNTGHNSELLKKEEAKTRFPFGKARENLGENLVSFDQRETDFFQKVLLGQSGPQFEHSSRKRVSFSVSDISMSTLSTTPSSSSPLFSIRNEPPSSQHTFSFSVSGS
jgi:serine/threonine protein kinase